MSKLDVFEARAAWWAVRAIRSARRGLARQGMSGLRLPPVPNLGNRGDRGVAAVLRRSRSTCLIRSAVRQSWLAARGRPLDLIIGVTAPGSAFGAHAWLEGDRPCADERFHELVRRPPG